MCDNKDSRRKGIEAVVNADKDYLHTIKNWIYFVRHEVPHTKGQLYSAFLIYNNIYFNIFIY